LIAVMATGRRVDQRAISKGPALEGAAKRAFDKPGSGR